MKRSLAGFGLLILSACTVGPNFVRPTPSPANLSYLPSDETAPARVDSRQPIRDDWWKVFGSSALDDLIVEAISHNQDIDAATEHLSEVRAQMQAVAGVQYPQADLHGGAAREKVNFIPVAIDLPPVTQNVYSVGATVSYALDFMGHDRRMAEAAAANADAARFQLVGITLTVTGTTALQAVALASLDARATLLSSQVAMDRKSVELVHSAREAGVVSERDVAHAEGQLAEDSAYLPLLRAQRAAVRHALSILLGKAPDEQRIPAVELESFTVPNTIPLRLPAELVHRRPDILAAEADLHAASAAIGIAEANRFPRVVLTADVTQWAKLPYQLWQDAATGAAVGAGLTAPILEGGRLAAEHSAAEHGYNSSLARYRQTVLQSFAQVATVLQAMAADDEAAHQSDLAADAAERDSHIADLQIQAGALGMLPYLAVKRQEVIARTAAIQAHTRQLRDCIELLVAMGGGQ